MTLVLGLGHPDRGDDVVGLLVCAALEGIAGVQVRAVADSTDLPALWHGEADVVLVDAVRDPARAAGDVVVLALHEGAGVPHEGSTHGFDLSAVLALADAVDGLPPRLHLVGVVGSSFGLGEAAADAVVGAVPAAVRAIRALARAVGEP